MTATTKRALGEREAQILRAIVDDYVRSGDPVGSQAVAPRCEVSAATVRSVMADLEEQGLLEKPHTSAGRRPTDLGYRYYVDSLLAVPAPEPIPAPERWLIEQRFVGAGPGASLQEASRLLHDLSHHAALVATPRAEATRLRQLDLVRLSDGRILAVAVTHEGRILNKLLDAELVGSAEELAHASRTLTALLQQELSVEAVRERLAREVAQERARYDGLVTRALDLVAQLLGDAEGADLLLAGQATLVGQPELDIGQMRSLFQALEEKGRLLRLLDRAVEAGSLQIFIGSESPLGEQAGVALVTSPYEVDGRVLGAVGVIGPTRMDYGRVISLVDFTARTVSKVLSHASE